MNNNKRDGGENEVWIKLSFSHGIFLILSVNYNLHTRTPNFMFGLCRIATGAALFALDPYLQVTMSSRTQMQSTKSQPSACVSDCGCHHDDDTSHTQPSTNKITGKEIVFADELSELTKIMDDDTHMVLCKPKSTPGFIKKLSDQSILLPEHLPSFTFEGMVSFSCAYHM